MGLEVGGWSPPAKLSPHEDVGGAGFRGARRSAWLPFTPFAPLLSLRAVTTISLPSRFKASELPNSSPLLVFEALTYCKLGPRGAAEGEKVTARLASCRPSSIRPCLPLIPMEALSSRGAPTATVLPSPLMAMRAPNQSPFPVFEAFRSACSVHVLPSREQNTTAAPDEVSVLKSLSHPGGLTPVAKQSSSCEPTASVLPSLLNDKDTPNESPFSAMRA